MNTPSYDISYVADKIKILMFLQFSFRSHSGSPCDVIKGPIYIPSAEKQFV